MIPVSKVRGMSPEEQRAIDVLRAWLKRHPDRPDELALQLGLELPEEDDDDDWEEDDEEEED